VLGVFGSVARGEDQPGSDLDLLVRFEPGRSLVDHAAVLRELGEVLEVPVDVISAGGVSDDDPILADLVPL
jgi:predicted nucleotidyltransferase